MLRQSYRSESTYAITTRAINDDCLLDACLRLTPKRRLGFLFMLARSPVLDVITATVNMLNFAERIHGNARISLKSYVNKP